MLQLPGTMWEFLQSTPARKPARRSEPNGSVWEPRCFQQNEVSTTVYAALVRYFCYFWPACIVQCADTQYDMCSVQVTNLTSRALRTLLSWPGNWIRSLACPLVDGKPEPCKWDFVDAMFGSFPQLHGDKYDMMLHDRIVATDSYRQMNFQTAVVSLSGIGN